MSPPPRYWWAATAALVVGAFALGYWNREPPDVREVEHVQVKERVVTVTRVVAEKAQTRVVVRDRLVTPDGTVREHEEEHEARVERTQTDAKVDAHQEAQTERRVEVTAARPQWRVGVLAGAQFHLDPAGVTPAFGAHVERRIAGPFSVGVWALHTGAAGLSISADF